MKNVEGREGKSLDTIGTQGRGKGNEKLNIGTAFFSKFKRYFIHICLKLQSRKTPVWFWMGKFIS